MLGKTVSLQIRTPEGVSFDLPLAGPVSRCLALAVDVVVVSILTGLIAACISFIGQLGAAMPAIADFSNGMIIIAQFVISIGYGMAMEWIWRGQTVGKRVMGLQVVDERGLNLSAKQVILRNVFRAVDGLPTNFYFLGGLACLLTKRCQRLGDIAAGTVVIRKVKVSEPATDQLFAGTENSFRAYPHLEARLRQVITPDEARVALDSVSRRDELENSSRLVVFSRLADHFRSQSEFPEEITLGLSDEQYVRNVVDTLYRSPTVADK